MMKKAISLLILVICSFCFFNCESNGFLMAKADAVMLTEAYPAKTQDAQFDVYYTNRPEKKYIELAQIICNDTDDNWNLKQIKIKAQEIGADGIIVLGKSSSAWVGIPVGNTSVVYGRPYGMKAVAIKYIEE